MSNVDNNYLIQGYFEGTLTPDEEALFQDKLENDPEFAQEVQDMEMLERGLSGLGIENFTSDVEDWEDLFKENRVINQPVSSAKVIGFSRYRNYFSIAAVIALLAGLTYIIPFLSNSSQITGEELYAEYYSPYENLIVSRGIEDSATEAEQILQLAMDAYNNEKYSETIDLLKQYLSKTNGEDLRPWLYIGISQMEAGDFASARESFAKVKNISTIRQQAEWYHLLSLLKENKDAEAIAMISDLLKTNPEHHWHDQMQRILNVLQEKGNV